MFNVDLPSPGERRCCWSRRPRPKVTTIGWTRVFSCLSSADAVEGVEVLGVGIGKGVEVLLSGGDLGVAHPVHHGLQVGPAGEPPGGVGVAEVVDPDLQVDPGVATKPPTGKPTRIASGHAQTRGRPNADAGAGGVLCDREVMVGSFPV
jgi:hypothetical protein